MHTDRDSLVDLGRVSDAEDMVGGSLLCAKEKLGELLQDGWVLLHLVSAGERREEEVIRQLDRCF